MLNLGDIVRHRKIPHPETHYQVLGAARLTKSGKPKIRVQHLEGPIGVHLDLRKVPWEALEENLVPINTYQGLDVGPDRGY